ncbi:PspA-associated protein PspAA [Nocardioides pakistanensis]
MIVRILGEGQWDLAEEHLTELNKLDDEVEKAVEAGDEETFTGTLAALLDKVRAAGSRLPDDTLHDSDLILPPADATIDEVRHMLEDDGLIPG